MPPVKDVSRLLDLSISCLNHLVREEALRVSNYAITQFIYNDAPPGSDDFDEELREKENADRDVYLSDQVEAFKQFILEHVPNALLDRVFRPVLIGISEAIVSKKQEWTPTTNMTLFTSAMYAITKFANIIVVPSRRELDLDQMPKMIRTKLYSSLPAFQNLTTLILGSGSGGWVTEAYADKFLLGLPHMKRLAHFSLKYDCTVNILQVLSETCRKTLKVLDIERSKQVRNESVTYILALSELVKINIFQTDLTTQGQADVLQGLPHLRHLDRGDFLADVVDLLEEKVAAMGKTKEKMPSLKIQEFWASEEYYFHTEEQMALVSKYCPDIRQMLFMFQKSSCQLSVLASFPHLEDLDLWGGAFYSDGLGDLLEQIGPTLKKLSLVHVEEMDMKSIAIISVTCPNLIKLNLVNCELEDDQHRMQNPDDPFRDADRILRMEKWREVQKMAAPMIDLEIIKIVSQCSEQYLTFLLSQCLNVREIFLGMQTSISDRVWADVLAKNSLSHLEKITIQKCSKVTTHGIEILLANCDRLTSLLDLSYFEGIREDEAQFLRQRVKEQNINLRLEEDRSQLMELMESNFMNYYAITPKPKYPAFDNSVEWEAPWAED